MPYHIAFSPDNRLVFNSVLGTRQRDGADIWDVQGRRLLRHASFCRGVFMPNGRGLVAVEPRTHYPVNVWQLLGMPVMSDERPAIVVHRLDLKTGKHRRSGNVRLKPLDRRGAAPLAYTPDRRHFLDYHLNLWSVP